MNLTPAWNANGVLPGAIWLMKPSAPGLAPFRMSLGSDVSGVQSNPSARPGARETQFARVVDGRVGIGVRIHVATIGQVVEIARQENVVTIGHPEVLLDTRIQLGKSRLVVGVSTEQRLRGHCRAGCSDDRCCESTRSSPHRLR